MSHLKIFWHFQNLQRAKLEPSLAFFVFQSCAFFFFFLLVLSHCFGCLKCVNSTGLPAEMHR